MPPSCIIEASKPPKLVGPVVEMRVCRNQAYPCEVPIRRTLVVQGVFVGVPQFMEDANEANLLLHYVASASECKALLCAHNTRRRIALGTQEGLTLSSSLRTDHSVIL